MAAGGLLKKDKFCNRTNALFRLLATMENTPGFKIKQQVLKQRPEVFTNNPKKIKRGVWWIDERNELGQRCLGSSLVTSKPTEGCSWRECEAVYILDDKIPCYASGSDVC